MEQQEICKKIDQANAILKDIQGIDAGYILIGIKDFDPESIESKSSVMVRLGGNTISLAKGLIGATQSDSVKRIFDIAVTIGEHSTIEEVSIDEKKREKHEDNN